MLPLLRRKQGVVVICKSHISARVNDTTYNEVNCQCIIVINSLAPGKFEWNSRYVIFRWILMIDGWGISCEIALIWMSLDLTDDQSTLVQVIAWYRQATSHYLSQCWPRSLSPYGITRPQWVKVKNMNEHFSNHILLDIHTFNTSHTEFLGENIIYLHFLSFLKTGMVLVVEILPVGRHGPINLTHSISAKATSVIVSVTFIWNNKQTTLWERQWMKGMKLLQITLYTHCIPLTEIPRICTVLIVAILY